MSRKEKVKTQRRGCLRWWKWIAGGVFALIVLSLIVPPAEENPQTVGLGVGADAGLMHLNN